MIPRQKASGSDLAGWFRGKFTSGSISAEVTLEGVKSGQVVATTDASGNITVGLTEGYDPGWEPAAVHVTPEAPRGGDPVFTQFVVDEIGQDSFQIRCFSFQDAIIASTEVTFRWTAFSQ